MMSFMTRRLGETVNLQLDESQRPLSLTYQGNRGEVKTRKTPL